MKLLFDENISHRLVRMLQDLYPDSQHVREQGMEAASDDVIWQYARSTGLTIVAKDSDFYYRSLLLGHPPKVVWLRVGNCTTATIEDLLRTRHADLMSFEQDPDASFLIVG